MRKLSTGVCLAIRQLTIIGLTVWVRLETPAEHLYNVCLGRAGITWDGVT